MHTIRLLYSSDALEGLRYRDFLTIMEKAAETNRERAITGMLCYGGGQFLQALEGERLTVNALYHHIAKDPRHSNCQLLSVEEIGARDFAEWSMKIIDWNDAVTAARQALLLKHSGSRQFNPSQMTAQQATVFLRDLAAMERLLTE
ncbi:BLUF domain-containing protein [Gemmatimonas sp.]|uniref:BLUF domain-containing protein n=1 Tax=Gemmatimonas sp. TaxID=1962908 RepID=UPI003983669B